MRKTILAVLLLLPSLAGAQTMIGNDNFTRSDATTLGSNWTVWNGSSVWSISGDTAIPTTVSGNGTTARWTASTFNNDQYATFSEAAYSTSIAAGAVVRADASGDGYVLYCTQTLTGNCTELVISVVTGGTRAFRIEATYPTTAIPPNTNITLQVQGSLLTVWVGGTQIDTGVTDTTWTSGSAGIYGTPAFTSTNGFTYWEGGNIGSTSSHTASASESPSLTDALSVSHNSANTWSRTGSDTANVSDTLNSTYNSSSSHSPVTYRVVM